MKPSWEVIWFQKTSTTLEMARSTPGRSIDHWVYVKDTGERERDDVSRSGKVYVEVAVVGDICRDFEVAVLRRGDWLRPRRCFLWDARSFCFWLTADFQTAEGWEVFGDRVVFQCDCPRKVCVILRLVKGVCTKPISISVVILFFKFGLMVEVVMVNAASSNDMLLTVYMATLIISIAVPEMVGEEDDIRDRPEI